MTNKLRLLFLSGALTAAVLLTGCAGTQYLDTATKEVPVSAMKKVAQAKPTQVSFEFMTKGAPNAAATKLLKDAVLLQVQESGLFAPASPGSAMLTISLNNIPLTDNASRQGFVTGLTFGLAGSAVTDGYVCTVSYLPAGQSTPIVKTARHAIHTTLGNANPPPGAGAPMDGVTAVKTMTRDIVSNALRDLSNDPTFN